MKKSVNASIAGIYLLFVSASPSIALEVWNCVVEDIKLFEDEPDFEAKNRQKKFLLNITETEVIAEASSPDFSSSTSRYQIYDRGLLDIHAISVNLLGLNGFSMPADPAVAVQKDGFFHATITQQGSFFANSWLLRCAE